MATGYLLLATIKQSRQLGFELRFILWLELGFYDYLCSRLSPSKLRQRQAADNCRSMPRVHVRLIICGHTRQPDGLLTASGLRDCVYVSFVMTLEAAMQHILNTNQPPHRRGVLALCYELITNLIEWNGELLLPDTKQQTNSTMGKAWTDGRMK